MTFTIPAEWGLTRQQAKLFLAVFNASDLIAKGDIQDVVSPCAEPKIIDVVLHNTRKKLRPFNVLIESRWGKGLRIAPEIKEALLAGAISIPEQERAAA